MKQVATTAILAIALLSGCNGPSANQLLTVDDIDGQLTNNIGIASFSTPNGWVPNPSNGNTVVMLTRKGANPKDAQEIISIDVGAPVSKGVKGSADGLAAKFGGTVSKLPYAIDGEDAYRVTIPPNYEQIQPRECIVIHHNQKVCFLFGGSKSKSDIWPTMTEIAESWAWN